MALNPDTAQLADMQQSFLLNFFLKSLLFGHNEKIDHKKLLNAMKNEIDRWNFDGYGIIFL